MFKELGWLEEESTKIYIDNKSTIALENNTMFYDHNQHINTCYHYISECITKKNVQLEYMKSKDQIVEIFTKSLKHADFIKLKSLFGMTIKF